MGEKEAEERGGKTYPQSCVIISYQLLQYRNHFCIMYKTGLESRSLTNLLSLKGLSLIAVVLGLCFSAHVFEREHLNPSRLQTTLVLSASLPFTIELLWAQPHLCSLYCYKCYHLRSCMPAAVFYPQLLFLKLFCLHSSCFSSPGSMRAP